MSLEGAHLLVMNKVPNMVDDCDRCFYCHTPGAELKEEKNTMFVVDQESRQAAHLECARTWYRNENYTKCELCQGILSDRDFEVLGVLPIADFHDGNTEEVIADFHDGNTEELIEDLEGRILTVRQNLSEASAELRYEKSRFGYGLFFAKPRLEAEVKNLSKEISRLQSALLRTSKFKGISSRDILTSSWKSIALTVSSAVINIGVAYVTKVLSLDKAPDDDPVRGVVSLGVVSSLAGFGVGIYGAWDAVNEVYSRYSYS